MDLYPKFQKIIEGNNLIEPAEGIVVGVSGGVDSVVLLDLLHRLSDEEALTLIVAHVNHGMRGAESDRDERFVKKLAGKYGLKCVIARSGERRSNPPKSSGGGRLLRPTAGLAMTGNIQSAARDFRYSFFTKVARRAGAKKIALAHHGDDQAETLLLHMIRGSGLTGLKGMPVSRRDSDGICLIRPLLTFSKDEILKYARQACLEFVEDATNRTKKYDRNIVRHDILPLLLKQNPKAVLHICETASLLQDEDAALDAEASREFGRLCKADGGSVAFIRGKFLNCHTAIQRRLLRLAYQYLTGGTKDLLSDHIRRMIHITSSAEGKGRYSLPSGVVFYRDGESCAIVKN